MNITSLKNENTTLKALLGLSFIGTGYLVWKVNSLEKKINILSQQDKRIYDKHKRLVERFYSNVYSFSGMLEFQRVEIDAIKRVIDRSSE